VWYILLCISTHVEKNLPQEDGEENFLEKERKMDDGYLDGNVS